ncbi:PAAR domain-containing protein [Paraburkholderia sp. EG287A]
MKKLIYEGDATSHGGKVLTGSDRIKVRGRRAARLYDRVSCPIHGENMIVEGGGRMKDQSTPLACEGNHTQCGAALIASTDGVRVR